MRSKVTETAEVFRYFEEICSIPHGSGNMDAIADYCLGFAKKNGLRALIDGAKNVVIYKSGTAGYENAEPIILQGHLDMVCPGSIVLFHNDADHTPEALPTILKCLKDDGYEFVFISNLILKENYTIDHTGKQCKIENN